MSFWSRLGFSVAIAAGFAMLANGWLRSQTFYASHQWKMCAALVAGGVLLCVVGALGRTKPTESDSSEAGNTAGSTNAIYAGVMLLIFAAIVALIVPKISTPAMVASPKPNRTNLVVAAVSKAPKWPALQLQGITHVDGKSSALINRKTYFAGDRIDNVELIQVDRESVVLKLGDETRGLKLK